MYTQNCYDPPHTHTHTHDINFYVPVFMLDLLSKRLNAMLFAAATSEW
jgi:hypothetical protein